jgi:hypothetical protein
MCEGFEWLAWQSVAEERAKKTKVEELKKQSDKVTAAEPVKPKEPQEDPVPA